MYNFIDVNEASESVVLPSEALKINGAYIEDQIPGYRTLNVSGREALSPDVETYTTGVRDGSKIKSKRYPERIIVVKYQLIAESSEAFREAYNKLAYILDVEDAELIFNDEQDKFFVGTPCIIGSVNPGMNAVVGEFEILCADPFKYSVIEYEAEPCLEDKSILIDYKGTYKSFPTLVAEFYEENDASEDGETEVALTGNGDCGYVAFFTEDEKIIQIGDPDEADAETGFAKSQTLANSTFNKSNSWGSAAQKQWVKNEYGSLAMRPASYAVPATPASTSGTLLTATSKANRPYFNYKVTAKTSGRTANSVKVQIAITASLGSDASYFGYSLGAAVYIGGAWHNVTMKENGSMWRGKTGHTKNITVTVTGLLVTTTTLSGIKFKAYRNDNSGTAGILNETACNNLPISMYIPDIAETYYLAPTSFGSGSDRHGPSIIRTLPADAAGEVGATDFTFTFAFKLSIGTGNSAVNQLGSFQAYLWSGTWPEGKKIVGFALNKTANGKKAELRLVANDKIYQRIDVDVSHGNKYFNSSKTATIKKIGQTVEFNICGITKTIKDSAISDAVVNQIIFTMSQYGTKPVLAYNGLYWAKFVKNNCDTWKDVPNKFSANDVVEADCGSGEISLNGVHTPSLGALGNDWEDFILTPGLNQIGVSYSDWVADDYAPKMKVRYREVFL
jgi:predicted phage tail component-like protein